MMSFQCIECKHYTMGGEIPTCRAFPNGIPDEIFGGLFDHSKPYPSAKDAIDGGIHYEPLTPDEDED